MVFFSEKMLVSKKDRNSLIISYSYFLSQLEFDFHNTDKYKFINRRNLMCQQ